MKELIVKGIQKVLDQQEVKVIEGGFDENQRVMLAKTIAKIHGVELKRINELINNNLDEFEFGIDILDLAMDVKADQLLKDMLLSLGYTNRGITATLNQNGNIYLLSEQGYFALVSLMKTDKARKIRKRLRREYFKMREIIHSNEQLKASLLLRAVESNGAESVIAIRDYTNLRIEEETKPLLDELEKLSPLADKYNIFLDTEGLTDVNTLSKNLAIKGLGRNNFYKYLREKQMLMKDNQPYQIQVDKNYFVVKPAGAFQIGEDTIQNYKTYITTKGVNKIIDMLIEDQYLAS